MAKKASWKNEKKTFDYRVPLGRLRDNGPARVYILRGQEDYLRDSFLRELKKACVEEGTEAFNYHRLEGVRPDLSDLREAVEAMPFLGERTLVEVRGFDLNRTGAYDAEALKTLAADVPDWATVAFVFSPGYAPDNRLGVVKAIKKAGEDIEFSSPGERDLYAWIRRQADALGKRIDGETAAHLVWVCGDRMNTLLPELTKIAGAARGEEIVRSDIDAVAKKAPETTIFDLTDALGARRYDEAARLLADLLSDPDEAPQMQIYMVSEQFRRLYAARTALDFHRPDSYITDCVPELETRPYLIRRLKETCRGFDRARLARCIRLCAECDMGMRSNGPAPSDLMKELILRLALDRA